MTYLEAVKIIKDIECKYDVMNISVQGIAVWPLLRIRLLERITGDDIIRKSLGFSAIKQVLNTLFYYNPLLYFRKVKVWVFSHNGSRNAIGDKRIERTTGCVIDAEPQTLYIEKPDAHQAEHPRQSIPEKQIVSESWLLMLVHLYAKLYPSRRIKITGEDCIKEVLLNYKIQFNYKESIILLIAQKRVFDLLLKVTHKPQKVVMECPYTIMGYVWSLHTHGIKVIEMQHGVLNKHHYAYNSMFHNALLYPDELWVFGEEEYLFMKSNECHYCNNVYKVGLFFLDYAKKYFSNDPFMDFRSNGMTICLVAGQTGYEEQMAKYVEEVASMNKDCLFVYVPRSIDTILFFKADNVLFRPGVNIYEYMLWCDIHVTISSTTCLECQYYHKPTIFYDYENRASVYYGDVLKKENGVIYTNEAVAFNKAKKEIINANITYREIFTNGTVQIMKNLLQ